MTSIISFPGLGIEGIKLNTVAFNILGKDVAWYGIIITCAIICAFMYVNWRAVKFEGLKTDDVLDYAIFCVIFGIMGARAYYVLTTLKVHSYDSFYDVIAIWNGGLAIYGGLIAGLLTILIVSKVKKLSPWKILDPLGPGLMLGQAIGRWGNFVNAEAFGSETELPWRMGIQNIYHLDPIYVHPTFLYECIWNLIGFAWVNLIYKKKRFDGQIVLTYVAWYGFGRMLIESLRTDSLYVGPFRISQLVGAASVVIGVVMLIILSFRADKKYAKEIELQNAEAAALSENEAANGEAADETNASNKLDDSDKKADDFAGSEDVGNASEDNATDDNKPEKE